MPGLFKTPIFLLLRTPPAKSRARVCLFSFHPLVPKEIQQLLEGHRFQLSVRRMDPSQAREPGLSSLPRAAIYLVDAHARRSVTESLVSEILAHHPAGRTVVLAEAFDETNAFPLLRLGVKGLLTYGEISLLPRALAEVAAGGYWVPRALLSRFVDVALSSAPPRRLLSNASGLTPRERQVLEGLLESLSNKEIAKRLQISERTAKFHVSNLLSKYRVKRRADLILLNFSQPSND